VVNKIAVLLLAGLLAAAAIACGGRDSSSKAPTPRPTATARATTGPAASIDPRNGPPGTLVTVSGTGWAPNAQVTLTGADVDTTTQNVKPYATVTSKADGSWVTSFRLEKSATGEDLLVGRYDLVAKSGSTSVNIMFLVETKRPVGGPVGGG
jgi:hypothetical protein